MPSQRHGAGGVTGVDSTFVIGALLSGLATAGFALWIVFKIDGSHVTLEVDDIGQWVAAWSATVVCFRASRQVSIGRTTWVMFAASSFAWGAGEIIWCYYALVKDIPVPFPSLADVGFLTGAAFSFGALIIFPSGKRSAGSRIRSVLDGCIIATSLLFASWAMILGPLYRSHQGSVLKQVISLAYPTSDVVMVSLVIILMARGGRPVRVHLALVMAGVVTFAVADSSFTYFTEVNSYSGGNYLDAGWVAGFFLIALGALWAASSKRPEPAIVEESTVSLIAPYLPVLVVLAVTGIQLLRGRQMLEVSWLLALALTVLVLVRELLRIVEQALYARRYSDSAEPSDCVDHDLDQDSLTRR